MRARRMEEHGKKITSTLVHNTRECAGGFAWNLWCVVRKLKKKEVKEEQKQCCANRQHIQNDNNWLELMSINRICNGEPDTKDYFFFSHPLNVQNELQVDGINVLPTICAPSGWYQFNFQSCSTFFSPLQQVLFFFQWENYGIKLPFSFCCGLLVVMVVYFFCGIQ